MKTHRAQHATKGRSDRRELLVLVEENACDDRLDARCLEKAFEDDIAQVTQISGTDNHREVRIASAEA